MVSTSRRAVLTPVVCLLLACALALIAAPADPGEDSSKAAPTRLLRLPPAEVTGRISYPDGQALAVGAAVRVWSADEARFVYETQTGEGGTYRLPALDPGRYQVVFADRVRVPLVVAEEEGNKPTVFHVVIPHGEAVFARMPLEQKAAVLSVLSAPSDSDDDDDSGLLPVVLIGGGTLTGVAILADSQDWFEGEGRRDVVSP